MLSSLSIVRRLVRRSPNDPPPSTFLSKKWLVVCYTKSAFGGDFECDERDKKKKMNFCSSCLSQREEEKRLVFVF